ncbi:Major facilitator superfamily domain, general substrate transporter [Artemisia annua]|uniref:Major facilitator superfamily domain, general substrate transporter n=1 Tax=Artemisia annua TaxID=35608 RepID=A0A2U1PVU9_ARTAN|nr:Major facilitator superfamily domain, general substrate transporter [Artemisia annua]
MALELEEQMNIAENGGYAKETLMVCDSSLDHKGGIPLRSSTGTRKAAFFIIAIEFSERLTFFAIASNLITYLTKVMHQDLTTAAKTVNCWAGVTTVMPLLGGFIADSYTGRFVMILLSSIIYLMGLGILTMSQFIPALKPCGDSKGSCVNPTKHHELVFFIGIYLLSIGTGGHKPSLESFGADQFDDNQLEERKGKMSFFNWWSAALCCGLVLGVTVLVYVEDNSGWGIANLILTVAMFIAIIIFYLGKPLFRYQMPQGSPLTPILQVFVAAMRKRKVPYPSSQDSFYEPENPQRGLLCHTDKLKFLDKACVVENDEITEGNKPSPWKLTTVTKVEETKLIVNIVPIWLASVLYGVLVAQGSTFFVKQSSTMDRKIGSSFVIPPASIQAFFALGMLFSVIIYDRIITPILRRKAGNERGIPILKRVGIGMFLSILCMIVAALVEKQRLLTAEKEKSKVLSMSAFWLAPQYLLLGIGDAFALVGLQEFFYDQVPDSMRSIGIALYLSVIGVGSFFTSFLIIVVNHFTKQTGKPWIGKDLTSSRLDKFYWLLAAIFGLNFCIFVLVAKRYSYKQKM